VPYILDYRRKKLNAESVGEVRPHDIGELTYVLYRICLNYWKRSRDYQSAAEIVGALGNTAHELYAQHFAAHEALKRQENGDVL
jgi:hypothetical protein